MTSAVDNDQRTVKIRPILCKTQTNKQTNKTEESMWEKNFGTIINRIISARHTYTCVFSVAVYC